MQSANNPGELEGPVSWRLGNSGDKEELADREGRGSWAEVATGYRGSKMRDMLSSLSTVRGQGIDPHLTGTGSTPIPAQGSHSYSATADCGHAST